jgi:hypothetical protein
MIEMRSVILLLVSLNILSFIPLGDASEIGEIDNSVSECVNREVEKIRGVMPTEWADDYAAYVKALLKQYASSLNFAERFRFFQDGFPFVLRGWGNVDSPARLEIHKAEIRWYIEHLMTDPIMDQATRVTLQEQCETVVSTAMDSLSREFPAISKTSLQSAHDEILEECHTAISQPLFPFFQRVFKQDELVQIIKLWDSSRENRSKLWREMETTRTFFSNAERETGQRHPDHVFARCAFSSIVTFMKDLQCKSPEYLQHAVHKRVEDLGLRDATIQLDRHREMEISGKFGVKLERAEQWGYILAIIMIQE